MPPISPLNKGIAALDTSLSAEEIVSRKWNLLREDMMLPAAVLLRDSLEHNLQWMQRFADAGGVMLAPHGKTTMAPALFRRQLDAGAWGITVATAQQAQVAAAHGVRRILMANQLIGRQNMAMISQLLEHCEIFCLVDSAGQIHQLGRFFEERRQRLNVLIELGVNGGRAGVRNQDQLDEVLTALGKWRQHLALCGIEIYEGVLEEEAHIRRFLEDALATTREIAANGRFQRSPIILTGAGSAWYDIVAEVFASAAPEFPAEVLLRPGCYLSHDVGAYQVAQQRIELRNPIATGLGVGLQPALQLWAYVQSVPESRKAIVAMGKRDAAFDAGLPVPALHYRPGADAPTAAPGEWKLTRMMDQHAYLEKKEEDNLQVGDMIGFDISHPCLTFDKWRWLAIVDADYNVIDMVETFF